jgi:predicted nucleotidyltransferase component of viral defense system
MNKKQLLKRFLYFLYRENRLAVNIHLDGGAALTFFYKIKRNFSNDLDFTIENEESFKALIDKSLRPFLKSFLPEFSINHSENKVEIRSQNNELLFNIDYYIVDPAYCDYAKIPLSYGKNIAVNCPIHSIEDIYVEKLFCIRDRVAERDIYDSIKIFRSPFFSYQKVNDLYQRKNGIKKSKLDTLSSYIRWFESDGKKTFLNEFSNNVDLKNNLEIFIKDLYLLR